MTGVAAKNLNDQNAKTGPGDNMADDLIRSIMVDEKREYKRQSLPELEPVDVAPLPETEPQPKSKAPKSRKSKSRGPAGFSVEHLKQRVLSYRPTRKHISLALLAFVVFMRPWLIPGLLFVAFWVALVAYLTLGHDRMAEILSSGWQKLATRKPETAKALRHRADMFALRFDALLSKLPDSWAEKLALPDLSQSSEDDEKLDELPDPFDRLKLPEVYRG